MVSITHRRKRKRINRPFSKKKKMLKKKSNSNGHYSDPMAFTWSEKYGDTLERMWNKIPGFLRGALATAAIFLMGLSINEEWLNIGVHIAKQFGFSSQEAISNKVTFKWSEISLESFRLQNLQYFLAGSCGVSYLLYFSIGGFLHWYFYVRQRDRPEEWKCQPKKFMKPDLERHEIIMGSATLLVLNIVTATMACYIANGGYSTVYYTFNDEYPWWWLILQLPLLFLYQDYTTYWLHRWYHHPFLYKHFHKLHHKYTHPTAFSVTAIHPFEAVHIQLVSSLPLFTLPVHWGTFYIVAMYSYYHGIIDHSGINFKSYWWQPWQPDAIFHDNHHQYFHVNFGFNCYFWDKIHGTYRLKDRVYTEDTYYGRGKHLSEVTAAELKADIQERLSENPTAYRKNQLEFELTQKDLQTLKKTTKNNKNEIM